MTDKTITLSAPITAHGEQKTSLTLRTPNGKDIRECGLPFASTVGESGEKSNKIETASVARYVRNLAGIPLSSVDQLTPADFINVTAAVVGFFTDTALTTETA